MSFNMKNYTLKVFASISSRVFQFLYTISIQMDFCGFFFHFFHMVVFCIVNQTFCQPMTWIYWHLNNCAMNWNWNSVRVCYMARSVAHTHTHITLNYMCGMDMDRGFANLQNEIIWMFATGLPSSSSSETCMKWPKHIIGSPAATATATSTEQYHSLMCHHSGFLRFCFTIVIAYLSGSTCSTTFSSHSNK